MISAIRPMFVGNALQLFFQPPGGSEYWRVLRNTADAFAGPDDPAVLRVYEGDDRMIVDTTSLLNGIAYYYRAYYWNGSSWTESLTNYGTPAATYEDAATDVLTFLHQRLFEGLKVETTRGNLVNDLGYVQVYTSAPQVTNDLRFPLVTLHLEDEQPAERGIGEDITGDLHYDDDDTWEESEGWLARVAINVMGWSTNGDERIELRKALRRVVQANLGVFASQGICEVSWSSQDVDALNGEYVTPLYQVLGSFTCLAPTRVAARIGSVADITVTVNTP